MIKVKEYMNMLYGYGDDENDLTYYISDDVVKIKDNDWKTLAIIKDNDKYEAKLPKKYADDYIERFEIDVVDQSDGDEGFGYDPGHIEITIILKKSYPGVKDKEPVEQKGFDFGLPRYMEILNNNIPYLQPDSSYKSWLEEMMKLMEFEPRDIRFYDPFEAGVIRENVIDWNSLNKGNELTLVNNYTYDWNNTLKRAFIVVLGAFLTYYEQGFEQYVIDIMFKDWLEYKLNG